jgi:hypothetical protein
VVPQLVANPGLDVLADVAAEPDRYAIEPKVDGIRCLVAYLAGRVGRDPQPPRRAARLARQHSRSARGDRGPGDVASPA